MPEFVLCTVQDEGKILLSVIEESALRDDARAHRKRKYRCSPIFPIYPEDCRVPDPRKPYRVGFYCFPNPFSIIGRLYALVPPEEQSGLWFSHGLAPLVVFCDSATSLERIRDHFAAEVRAYEWWSVTPAQDGGEVSVDRWEVKPPELTPGRFPEIRDYSDLPPDAQAVLDDLVHSLNSATMKACTYMPGQARVFMRLADVVNEVIAELQFLYNSTRPRPPFLSEAAARALAERPAERQKLIHQRIGDLAQIMTSLGAAVSQAFAGTVPILRSECPLGRYSLLGIGTAQNAVLSFSRFVESVFERYPIDTVVKNEFAKPAAVEIFPNLMGWDPRAWQTDPAWNVDYYLEDIRAEPYKSNLVYFSADIGFRESTYAITAPLQVLSLADTACWSPITMSHELLHAHVRAVMAAVFADPGRDLPQTAFESFSRCYRDAVRGKATEPMHLIDSIRCIIMNFCVARRAFAEVRARYLNRLSSGERKLRGKFVIPPADSWDVELADAWRAIHEVVTHVLDYRYFYDGNDELYLGLLWESWAPVPSVLDDVEQYVWRSILAISSTKEGLPTARFERSCDILQACLEAIVKRDAQNAVAAEALALLRDPDMRNIQRSRFQPGLYLVDVVVSFFLSAHIHRALYEDSNCTKREGMEGVYQYAVDTAEFRDTRIMSPVGLVADRLHRSLLRDAHTVSDAHRAAWMLLACASTEGLE